MHYTDDVDEMKLDNNNVIIETPAGNITDHAPESYYESNKVKITTSSKINKNTISFLFPTSNPQSQTIIYRCNNCYVNRFPATPRRVIPTQRAADVRNYLLEICERLTIGCDLLFF